MSDSKDQPIIDENTFIVGIGSSAGGLEALRELVQSLPDDLNATYIVAQHMSPDHKSMLTELIGRETGLPVVHASAGLELRRNTVHVTPPNTDVLLEGAKLVLKASKTAGIAPKPSIDRLLKSLAAEAGSRAVAVILSGTGSDGAYGIQAVREAGGITIAQDEKSAKYDGMPVAAVETGCVDLVLSPFHIGTHLAKIIETPNDLEQFRTAELNQHPFSDLLQMVYARTRVDFRDYKQLTIQRRLERRMTALGIGDKDSYTSYMRSNPEEIDALFKDFLISVTRFFRDPLEFEAMRPIIRHLAQEERDSPIRIWVAGCATGEEAYSIAMLFAAELEAAGKFDKDALQIFATDIDTDALKQARIGRYSASALEDIPPDLAERYVERHDDVIQIDATVKSLVLFSEHNICQDPPFLHQDLICCRNLLIYFNPTLQSPVLARLSYAMSQDGYLFLGTAESGTVSSELFRKAAGQKHVLRRRTGSRSDALGLHQSGSVTGYASTPRAPAAQIPPETLLLAGVAESLVAQLGRRAVLLTEDHRILRIFGDITDLLELSGETKLQFSLTLLIPAIGQDARTVASIALRRKERRKGQVIILNKTAKTGVQIEAIPLTGDSVEEPYVLVLFNEVPLEESPPRASETVAGVDGDHIRSLQTELDVAREALQQTIEELETSNEEYQSTNEELQSSNEELQATNEELETSNEELQSTNEELVTVNEELQVSKYELEAVTEEQAAVLASISIPLVIVDTALQIRTMNDAAATFFSVKSPVARMHISQLRVPRGFPDLIEICDTNLRLGRTSSAEFEAEGTKWILEVATYYSQDGQIRGATLALWEERPFGRLTAHRTQE
jgi:two-component system CheB/CheR fusion protein